MSRGPADRGFDASYEGDPPWDIGRAQGAVVRLIEGGFLSGDLIDVGCGTGENALAAAAHDARVLGIDASPRAVGKAIDKARERGLSGSAEFLVADVFALEGLGRRFDAALDCGLFHVFDDHERPVYAASVAGVVPSGGALYVLCFSDRQPEGRGPRRVSQRELRDTFSGDWQIRDIVATTFETNLDEPDAQAWLASVDRI